MTVLIGLDVGTTGVKALRLSPEGEVLARAEESYSLSTPKSGWAEQDPEDWWQAAEAALARVGRGQVAGIGLSGQMHGLVVLDSADRVLRPAILWNDQRTAEESAEIEADFGLPELVRLTGNRAIPGFTAPKLLWVRRHEPEVFERIAHVLLPKDYVRLRLTGELATDVADASGTLLFDVAHRHWSDAVAESLDIPRDWLPAALESPASSGQTADGLPVAAGAGDQAAGALGVGIDGPGPLSIVLGSWASSLPRCPISRPIPRDGCTRSATLSRAAGMRWESCFRPRARWPGSGRPWRPASRSKRLSQKRSDGRPASKA